MTAPLIALGLVVIGALVTHITYRLGMTAGVRLGYGIGHAEATNAARRLVAERIAQMGEQP